MWFISVFLTSNIDLMHLSVKMAIVRTSPFLQREGKEGVEPTTKLSKRGGIDRVELSHEKQIKIWNI